MFLVRSKTGQTKISKSLLANHNCGALFLALLSITSMLVQNCASSGQGEDQASEPTDEGADGLDNASLNANVPKNNAAAGAAVNNAAAASGNNFTGANNGAAINNAVLDNSSQNPLANTGGNPLANPASNPTQIPINNSKPINAPQSNGTNLLAEQNAAAPSNTAAPTNAATTPEASTAPTAQFDRMNASPFTNPQSNWPAKGKVKYITRKVTKHSSKDGPVVGELNVGNHPLIFQNGNWVELSNGTFVKGNATSDTPIGYPRRPSGAYGH
jgi:hypothetical protein